MNWLVTVREKHPMEYSEESRRLAPPTPDLSGKKIEVFHDSQNIIRIIMVIVDSGYIPFIEQFFLNIEAYFFLNMLL